MKILKVEFKNINSLQGEHQIDFREAPFHGDTLFAITGATGSGKSTLLDIIALALFNRTPRFATISKKVIVENGALLTRGQKDAYARVTYECTKGEYISEWSISTASTGNLRDYEMQVSDVLTQTSLVDKKSEVPTKNEELIGLKYDQFVKSVMLAQGAFAEFLISKKSERTYLLEKITGTDIYRKLGIKAWDKYKEIRSSIEDLEKEKTTWQSQLLGEEDLKEIKTNKSAISSEIKLLEELEKSLQKDIELKTLISSTQKKYSDWETKEKLNVEAIEMFERNEGIALQKHKIIEPIQYELNEWNRIEKENLIIQEKLKDNSSKKKEHILRKDGFHQELKNLLQKEVSENDYETALAAFEKQVLNLIKEFDKKKNLGSALKNEISAHISPLNIKFGKDNYEDILANLKLLKSEAYEFIIKNRFEEIDREKCNNEIEAFQDKLEILQHAKTDALQIQNLQKELNFNKTDSSEIEKFIKDLPAQIKSLEISLKQELSTLEILELKFQNQKLFASLEEHRQHLIDGEACPLCGALEHPFAKGLPLGNENEISQKITKQKLLIDEIGKQFNKQQTTLKLKQDAFHKVSLKRKDLLSNEKELIEKFNRQYTYDLTTVWDTQSALIKDKILLLQTAIKHKLELDITHIVIPQLEQMLLLVEEATQIRKDMKSFYDSDIPIENKVNSMEKKWHDLQSEYKLIIVEKENFDSEKSKLHNIFQKVSPIINEKITNDFEDIQQAFNALLAYEDLQKLVDQKKQLSHQKHEISINKVSIFKDLSALKLKDVETTTEDLSLSLTSKQMDKKEKHKALEQVNRLLHNQDTFQTNIKDISLRIQEESKNTKHWVLLNKLIGDATGNKFNNFAQDLTLLQLLHLANKRLALLSNRYIIDNTTQDKDDYLVVIDEDMGGQRRSVKTLSGGETFLLSLALALALSDLASNKVQIKSLFIDEGFGTLDPDTLDQTLTTLEQLQDEGSKMIGIISHVTTLKERIPIQIQIIPNGRGFSSVKVVG